MQSNCRSLSTVQLLYLGLGEMGYRIAGTLSKTYPTTVWNRTTSKAIAHAEEYQTTALTGENPFDSDLSEVDVILTCLPTSKEVRYYAEKLLESNQPLKKGLIWLDNTSGEPDASAQIAELLRHKEVSFLDTPISGGRKGATNASLTIMIAGPKPDFDKSLPILQKMGQNISHIGEQVGQAHAVKGLNNLLYGCNILLAMKVAQALDRYDIDSDKALKAMMTSSGGSNSMVRVHEYVTHNRTIDYSFTATNLIKDMEIGLKLIDQRFENDPSVTMFETIRDIYKEVEVVKGERAEVFDAFTHIEKV